PPPPPCPRPARGRVASRGRSVYRYAVMQVMALGIALLFCIAVLVPSCLMGLIFAVLGVMIMTSIPGRQRVVVAVTRALNHIL
ncbi:hypothetical protein B4Q13_17045, partial [Lacticaseibacillus rhamnosus]